MSFDSLGLIGRGFDIFGSWIHGVGGGVVGRQVGHGFFGLFYNVSVRGTRRSCVSSVGGVVWLSYFPCVLTVFIGYRKSYFRFIGGLIIM